MNKREAITIVLEDEEAEAQQEQGATMAQTMISHPERYPPSSEQAAFSSNTAAEAPFS